MGETDSITATNANRSFSALLRRIKLGEAVTITERGVPIARLVPVGGAEAGDDEAARRREAALRLLAHLEAEPIAHIGKFDRNELYEDE